mgnify:CR=1 FL=1
MARIADLISQDVRDKITRESKIEKKIITGKKYSIPDNDQNTLSYSEKELLKKHYLRATSLESGTRTPRNYVQKHFVLVCKGQAAPVTEYERVYKKYIKIRELEKEALNAKYRSVSEQAVQKESTIAPKENDQEKHGRIENAEAALRLAERHQSGTNISEYEEGYPKSEFGSREDHKRMRARDWGDIKRRNIED